MEINFRRDIEMYLNASGLDEVTGNLSNILKLKRKVQNLQDTWTTWNLTLALSTRAHIWLKVCSYRLKKITLSKLKWINYRKNPLQGLIVWGTRKSENDGISPLHQLPNGTTQTLYKNSSSVSVKVTNLQSGPKDRVYCTTSVLQLSLMVRKA